MGTYEQEINAIEEFIGPQEGHSLRLLREDVLWLIELARAAYVNDNAEDMEAARLRWAKSKARALGLPEDHPQISTLGCAVWEAAFLAGMTWEATLANRRCHNAP